MAHRIQRCGKDVRYAAVVCDYRNGTAVPSRHQGIRVNDMMHDLTLICIIALIITAGHKGCVALGFYRDQRIGGLCFQIGNLDADGPGFVIRFIANQTDIAAAVDNGMLQTVLLQLIGNQFHGISLGNTADIQ